MPSYSESISMVACAPHTLLVQEMQALKPPLHSVSPKASCSVAEDPQPGLLTTSGQAGCDMKRQRPRGKQIQTGMQGTWVEEERVRFARSAASLRRMTVRGLPLMSFLYLRLNSWPQHTGGFTTAVEQCSLVIALRHRVPQHDVHAGRHWRGRCCTFPAERTMQGAAQSVA